MRDKYMTPMRAFIFIVVITFSSLSFPCEQAESEEINSILKRDGFSGIIDDNANIEFLGDIKNAFEQVHIYYYSREFGNHRLAQRLLFINHKKKYIGMFDIYDKPNNLNGDTILFDYREDIGNTIKLTNKGVPLRVYLDGDVLELFK